MRFEDLNIDQIVELMDRVEGEDFDPGKETYDERINKILQEEGMSAVSSSNQSSPRDMILQKAREISRQEDVPLGASEQGYYKTKEGKFVLDTDTFEAAKDKIKSGEVPGISSQMMKYIEQSGSDYVTSKPPDWGPGENASGGLSEGYYAKRNVFYNAAENAFNIPDNQDYGFEDRLKKRAESEGRGNMKYLLKQVPREQYRQAGYSDPQDFMEKEMPYLLNSE